MGRLAENTAVVREEHAGAAKTNLIAALIPIVVPIGRTGTAEEVAAVVAFLASDESSDESSYILVSLLGRTPGRARSPPRQEGLKPEARPREETAWAANATHPQGGIVRGEDHI